MKAKGYELEVKIYDDYVLPNTATEDGDLDANYFQHTPYLNDFNANNGTHLVSVAAIHYEPFGLYAGTSKSLTDLPAGAKIAIPNDGSNEARALFLLEACGLIKLKAGTGFTATKQDIAETNGYEIVEMVAAVIPSCLDSVDLAVINGNYAIQAGLKIADALATRTRTPRPPRPTRTFWSSRRATRTTRPSRRSSRFSGVPRSASSSTKSTTVRLFRCPNR